MLKLPRPSKDFADRPRKSRTRGIATDIRRSKNSYILSRRRGTLAPIDQPSLTLNAATDFLALVTTGFWPEITAKSAVYNSKNYNTNFSKNINISYPEHEIECKKLDLLFSENLAILYDNIIYTGSKTKLFADRLEIDLITKNSKISMNDKNTKIKMFYNK